MSKNDGFLPEGYAAPDAGGNYMKFAQGSNEFRILSRPLIGWEYWTPEDKPMRIEGAQKPAIDPNRIKVDPQGNRPIKHFWAFVVYNYKAKAIQILQITQARVQKDLESLIKNPKWGSPFAYDINVTKTGEKLLTKYQVVPTPPSEASEEVKKAYKDKSPINLKALLTNDDPFAGAKAVAPTPPPPPAPVVVEEDGSDIPF